jgi:hypothetical protein
MMSMKNTAGFPKRSRLYFCMGMTYWTGFYFNRGNNLLGAARAKARMRLVVGDARVGPERDDAGEGVALACAGDAGEIDRRVGWVLFETAAFFEWFGVAITRAGLN